MTAKATSLIESHSTLATLLAILCLAFTVNYFFFGPGSDGGSGLGGTGKFGGESGLGGTGKTPDSGPSFKLGSNETDDDKLQSRYDKVLSPNYQQQNASSADRATSPALLANLADNPFDVSSLHLSPVQAPPVESIERILDEQEQAEMISLVSAITLESGDTDIKEMLQEQKAAISSDALVSSLDILNSLMIAETESNLHLATTETVENTDVGTRSRVVLPVRPERPDRLNIPTRVNAVQRTAIPAPPPVRPMRTLSSLLNR